MTKQYDGIIIGPTKLIASIIGGVDNSNRLPYSEEAIKDKCRSCQAAAWEKGAKS